MSKDVENKIPPLVKGRLIDIIADDSIETLASLPGGTIFTEKQLEILKEQFKENLQNANTLDEMREESSRVVKTLHTIATNADNKMKSWKDIENKITDLNARLNRAFSEVSDGIKEIENKIKEIDKEAAATIGAIQPEEGFAYKENSSHIQDLFMKDNPNTKKRIQEMFLGEQASQYEVQIQPIYNENGELITRGSAITKGVGQAKDLAQGEYYITINRKDCDLTCLPEDAFKMLEKDIDMTIAEEKRMEVSPFDYDNPANMYKSETENKLQYDVTKSPQLDSEGNVRERGSAKTREVGKLEDLAEGEYYITINYKDFDLTCLPGEAFKMLKKDIERQRSVQRENDNIDSLFR